MLPWAPPGRPGAGAGSKRSLGQPQPLEQAILPGGRGRAERRESLACHWPGRFKGRSAPPRARTEGKETAPVQTPGIYGRRSKKHLTKLTRLPPFYGARKCIVFRSKKHPTKLTRLPGAALSATRPGAIWPQPGNQSAPTASQRAKRAALWGGQTPRMASRNSRSGGALLGVPRFGFRLVRTLADHLCPERIGRQDASNRILARLLGRSLLLNTPVFLGLTAGSEVIRSTTWTCSEYSGP